ncbi:MAG: ankyrin repeat domain-containing protein [Alsobacter sp.]
MHRAWQAGFLVLGIYSAGVAAASPARADVIPCGDLERKTDLSGPSPVLIELVSQSFTAAENGCDALLERLFSAGVSPLARDRDGNSALARAAAAGKASTVALLIAKGSDLEQRNLQGGTPLFVAAQANRTRIVQQLAEAGANIESPGRSGVSPLSAAAYNGNDKLVEWLIARGADAKGGDATGKAPIVYAAARGFEPIVRRLLDAGIDVNAAYGNDLTVLMWAAGHANDAPEPEGVATVALLIERGAKVNAKDNRGRTPLMIAAELGHAAIVKQLLAAGADASVADKEGKTARDLAQSQDVRSALGS